MMKILILLIFVSLVFVVGALLSFALSVKNEDFDHMDELSLLPLEDEENATTTHDDNRHL
jgi:nitrogen fixation-related uncharacterized protein